MSDKSPLFVSAMELIAHATELYTLEKPRKYKFVILHLANSIELILKDRLVDKGVSIYLPKMTQTLGIWEALDQLDKAGIRVPERPVIELLIDDRNTLQHRFGFPDAQTVYFYLEQVVTFFKRFLKEEYSLDLAEVLKVHLSKADLEILGLAEDKAGEESALDKLFALSPVSAVLQAFNLIEARFLQLLELKPSEHGRPVIPWQHPDFPHLLDDLVTEGYITVETARKFDLLRQMRNRAAHAAHFESAESSANWAEAIAVAKDLLSGLDRALREDFAAKRREKRKPRDVLPTNDLTSPSDTEQSERLKEDFRTAAEYVLEKNAELYKRLS
jgi:uncharacterized protein YutE (UPF0331/DUF86 family)